jgi:hypothetical protein
MSYDFKRSIGIETDHSGERRVVVRCICKGVEMVTSMDAHTARQEAKALNQLAELIDPPASGQRKNEP